MNNLIHYIGCVTYYGEYLPFAEPHVFADNEENALKKCYEFCGQMNQKQLSIKVYPYVNGYAK
jgi:hypothetical protein